MTALLQLPDITRALVLSLYHAGFIALLFLLIIRLTRMRCPRACLMDGLLLATVIFVILCLMEGQRQIGIGLLPADFGCLMGNLPWAIHALMLAGTGIYSGWGLLRERIIARTEITPDSIREALDNLPSGLCFSDADGRPLLTNRRMYDLAGDAGGRFLRNAEVFWQSLAVFEGRDGITPLQGGPSPVLRWPDGSVWCFSKTELTLPDQRYNQTTAANVTGLHKLSSELAESNAALDRQQKRLKKLLERMIEITREEEILAFKVHIHNELGRCVLAGRRSLDDPTPEGVEQALTLWREVANRLEISAASTTPTAGETLRQLIDLAALLGCSIELNGELPENENAAYLLLTAVREAITNAVRHAGASRVMVALAYEGDTLAAQMTNNGNSCPDSIAEGGGLTTLRSRIEQAGGELKILCNGGVSLHLRLPLTGEEE